MKKVVVAASGALLAAACLAGEATAQTPVGPPGRCEGIEDLRGFTIRDARLEDPFWILRWRRPSAAILSAVESLKGQPYAFDTVDAVSTQIESGTWLPASPDAWMTVNYSDIGLVDCRNQQLDVVFTIFSATVSPTLSTMFEWGAEDRTANETAGVAQTRAAWQLAPRAGFDRARGFAAGGRAQATWTNSLLSFGALEVDGMGSAESHAVSASLVGEHESVLGWLRRANWRVLFNDASTPAGDVQLDDRSFGVQLSATSRPLKGVVARLGGVLEGGRLESGFAPSQLPPQTVPGSDFTSLKLFGGVTARRRQQSFAGSYALILGSTGSGFRGDWRKHIGDVAHEMWLPFGDHRLLEIEQRLTAGRLQTIDAVPATERFFGGAGAEGLLVGDDWRLRVNPVVRSIPTNRFSVTATGAGGDRFIAYNSTTAFTVWGTPVVPAELSDDEEFQKKLRGQLVSARSTLDIVYRSGDPGFQAAAAALPGVVAALERVETVEAAARAAGVLPDAAFDPCEEALQASRFAADRALADRPFQAYGWVAEMLPDGSSALADVVSSCGVDLTAKIKGAGADARELESASSDLEALSKGIETRFAAIDTERSAERAGLDMAYAERAIDVIMNQMSITSISPVFVFDVAHLNPAGDDPYSGTRYAVGGGIRFTLASTVSMTATYAVNPRRKPGEGSGALVFSLTTRNLFE